MLYFHCMHPLLKPIYFYTNLVASHLLFAPYYRSNVPCIKLGNLAAAWWVPEQALQAGSIVYSGGVGNDISFELALCNKYKMTVFTFDPTPAAIKYVSTLKKSSLLHFYPWGLWSENTQLKFFVPQNKTDVSHSVVNLQQTNEYFLAECKTIPTLMKKLKHKKIDVLKIDIEGAEYAVLNSLLESAITPKVICVEFDQPASLFRMWQMVQKLLAKGYIVVKQDYFNLTFYLP